MAQTAEAGAAQIAVATQAYPGHQAASHQQVGFQNNARHLEPPHHQRSFASDLGAIFKISNLNPYQNKWTIKARLATKGDIRHWKNAKGEGQLFSVTLSDDSGDIRATGFGDAVTAHYDNLVVGQCYYVSKCQIKVANKQYSNVNNDYEMSIDVNSVFQPCTDGSAAPALRYTFVELSRLYEAQVNSFIDLMVVLKECGEIQKIMSKKQVEVLYNAYFSVDKT